MTALLRSADPESNALAEVLPVYVRKETPAETAQRIVADAFRLALRCAQDRIAGRKRAVQVRA